MISQPKSQSSTYNSFDRKEMTPKLPTLDGNFVLCKNCNAKHKINLKPRKLPVYKSTQAGVDFLSPSYDFDPLNNVKLVDHNKFSFVTPKSSKSDLIHGNLLMHSAFSSIKVPELSQDTNNVVHVRPLLLKPRLQRFKCRNTQDIAVEFIQDTPVPPGTQTPSDYVFETPMAQK
jgi:hypothetical protein